MPFASFSTAHGQHYQHQDPCLSPLRTRVPFSSFSQVHGQHHEPRLPSGRVCLSPLLHKPTASMTCIKAQGFVLPIGVLHLSSASPAHGQHHEHQDPCLFPFRAHALLLFLKATASIMSIRTPVCLPSGPMPFSLPFFGQHQEHQGPCFLPVGPMPFSSSSPARSQHHNHQVPCLFPKSPRSAS